MQKTTSVASCVIVKLLGTKCNDHKKQRKRPHRWVNEKDLELKWSTKMSTATWELSCYLRRKKMRIKGDCSNAREGLMNAQRKYFSFKKTLHHAHPNTTGLSWVATGKSSQRDLEFPKMSSAWEAESLLNTHSTWSQHFQRNTKGAFCPSSLQERICSNWENRNKRFHPKDQGTLLPPSPCTRGWGWQFPWGWHIPGEGLTWLWSLLGWWPAEGVAFMVGGSKAKVLSLVKHHLLQNYLAPFSKAANWQIMRKFLCVFYKGFPKQNVGTLRICTAIFASAYSNLNRLHHHTLDGNEFPQNFTWHAMSLEFSQILIKEQNLPDQLCRYVTHFWSKIKMSSMMGKWHSLDWIRGARWGWARRIPPQ